MIPGIESIVILLQFPHQLFFLLSQLDDGEALIIRTFLVDPDVFEESFKFLKNNILSVIFSTFITFPINLLSCCELEENVEGWLFRCFTGIFASEILPALLIGQSFPYPNLPPFLMA